MLERAAPAIKWLPVRTLRTERIELNDRLPDLVCFVRVAEAGSFVGAAHRLGLSASAVGKGVARLEATLGARLFTRSTRRLTLTDAGELYLARCRRALADLDDARGLVQQMAGEPRGRLRVSLPTIGYHFLMPHMAAFTQRHPAIELELDFNDRAVDVIGERVDVAIRSGEPRDSELKSRRLGDFRFLVCAAPSYLAGLNDRGGLQRAADLRGLAALRYQHPGTGRLQPWSLADGDEGVSGLRDVVVANNMEALVCAALTGMGLIHGPDFLLQRYVDRGDLVRVLDRERLQRGHFRALWSAVGSPLPKVRAFVDFAAGRLFSAAAAG